MRFKGSLISSLAAVTCLDIEGFGVSWDSTVESIELGFFIFTTTSLTDASVFKTFAFVVLQLFALSQKQHLLLLYFLHYESKVWGNFNAFSVALFDVI